MQLSGKIVGLELPLQLESERENNVAERKRPIQKLAIQRQSRTCMLYTKNEAQRDAAAPMPDRAMKPGLKRVRKRASGSFETQSAHGSGEGIEGAVAEDARAAGGPFLMQTRHGTQKVWLQRWGGVRLCLLKKRKSQGSSHTAHGLQAEHHTHVKTNLEKYTSQKVLRDCLHLLQ